MTESNPKQKYSSGMTRRGFVQLAGLGSAYLLMPVDLLEALETSNAKPPQDWTAPTYAALHALPPGAVRPDGWLAGWLNKQADGLGSQLPETSWPFTDNYWQGAESEKKDDEWWPWEQKAYWVDGATRLALVTGNDSLLQTVHGPIDYTVAHARSDGYLGPETFRSPDGDFHRWPQNVFFRGLVAVSDSMPDQANSDVLVEAVRKHYLGDNADYATRIRNITNVENILWCYGRTGDPRLLAMAEKAWAEYAALSGTSDGADLQADRVFADTPIDAHGVSYAEISKQPAILYMYTGKQEYLNFALAAQKRIFDHHMLIDGIPSTSEHYANRTSLDSHETCDISDHTWTWGYVLMASGDGIWGDRVERAAFNAGFGAIKKDWKGVQYFSCPNQFIATQTSDHNAMNEGHQMMSYQPNPGHATACCGGDVHRLFPNYVMRMWMRDPQGGLTATLYGPCTLKTTVGDNNHAVEIVETTDYPFDERIHFTIHTGKPIAFPLSLRLPAWCESPTLLLNGDAHPMPAAKNGFVTIQRKFHPGDTVTLVLPMRTAISHWPEDSIALEHGPLVYALPIAEKWSPVFAAKWSTADFPMWDAHPTSAWNYGLAIDPETLAEQVQFSRRPVSSDPWIHPPVNLTVPARTIDAWKLVAPLKTPDAYRTPPLPSADARKATGPEERVVLVPYGSTHLRVTIFPELKVKAMAAGDLQAPDEVFG